MNNRGIIMHDGNFGADWVNITQGPTLIAQVKYQHDGSQRDNARRIVYAWNHIDVVTAEREAVLSAGRVFGKTAGERMRIIDSLAERLLDVRERIEPGMRAPDVAALLVDINKTLALVR